MENTGQPWLTKECFQYKRITSICQIKFINSLFVRSIRNKIFVNNYRRARCENEYKAIYILLSLVHSNQLQE